MTPPAAGADLRAALVASCFLGALPPVDLRAVCFVRAIGAGAADGRREEAGRVRRIGNLELDCERELLLRRGWVGFRGVVFEASGGGGIVKFLGGCAGAERRRLGRWVSAVRWGWTVEMALLAVPIRVTGDAATPLADAAVERISGPTRWSHFLSP